MKDKAFVPAEKASPSPIGKAKIPKDKAFVPAIRKGPSAPIARSGKVAKK